jgi:serine/threonine protein phosphatase 1
MNPTVLKVRHPGPVAVIGDLHGRADLLHALLDALGDLPLVVVGDVCDRGDDTRGVIERLVDRGAVGVLGNHDEWLAAWANGEGFDRLALSPMMSGDATLRSYGVEGRSTAEIESQRWRVPEPHRRWLAGLAVAIDLEAQGARYWVVHAGIPASADGTLPPDRLVPTYAEQHRATLLWSAHGPERTATTDRTVVMGHCPRTTPVDLGHVIAVDTGCGTLPTGALTAVVLPERRFVTVR